MESHDKIENVQESGQDRVQEPNEKIEDHVQKEESDGKEGGCTAEQARSDAEEEKGSEEENSRSDGADIKASSQQYSCSYTPPYYVPNFTVVESETEKKPKKKSAARHAWIAVLVVFCLGISFVAGGFSGYLCANLVSPTETATKDDLTVIKNDGSITVNEKLGTTGYNNLTVSGVVALVADSVVEITTTQVQTDSFFGNYVTSGAGSGVLVDVNGNGYIITNNHVIEGADQITVRLTSGAEYTATCLGGDDDFDIAVLKIEATGLTYATMGSSAALTVGDEVVAIGNPLGELGGTVTNGIISALDRNVTVDGHQMTLLQTNAAINPGNSGGGLFNMAGELIGIVNAKQSDTGIEGLGFAIPIDIAWAAAQDIIEHGYVTGKPDYGFEVAEATSSFQETEGWYRYTYPAGVYVVQSSHDTLKRLDRVVSINGITINNISDFNEAVNSLKIGDVMEITISRREGTSFKQSTAQVTVVEYVPSNTK